MTEPAATDHQQARSYQLNLIPGRQSLQQHPSVTWPDIAYSAITSALSPLALPILARRLTRGKEDPERWREKLGITDLLRPPGQLIWMHAVSVGELLALRGLVTELAGHAPTARFLLTSTSTASAVAIARNMPERSVHQFLPLDFPGPRRRFLDHWRPDLAIWAEQDLWPGLVAEVTRRGIPQAFINVRMNSSAFRRRRWTRPLWRVLYESFELIAVQDEASARHVEALGAPSPVRVVGSFKPLAPPLSHGEVEAVSLRKSLVGRPVWVAASTHPEDETVVFSAIKAIQARRPEILAIIAPRHPARGKDMEAAACAAGFQTVRRTDRAFPASGTEVFIADTIGELGLWYRMADVALIGGTFSESVQGHNPWEPVQLGCPVLYGPHVANFTDDYAALAAGDGARAVGDADELAAAVLSDDLGGMADRAFAVIALQAGRVRALVSDIASCLEKMYG